MSNPGQFKDFSKAASDLLNKVFPSTIGENQWGFEYALKPASNISGTAKIVNKGGVASGELSDDITFEELGFTLSTNFKTASPSLDVTIKVDDKLPVDGLTAKLYLNATGGSKSAQTGGVSLHYARENITFNSRVYVPITKSFLNFVDESALADQDTRLDVDFVTTHPDYKFYLGGQSKLSFATSQAGAPRTLDEAQLRVGYREGDFNGSVGYKTATRGGKETRTVCANFVTKPGETTYAGDVDYNLETKSASLSVGMEYPLNDGARLKIKADTNKQVGLAYVNKFARGSELQVGTLLAVDTSGSSVNLGSSFSANLKFSQ